MREDPLTGRVVSGAVDVELARDLGAWRGAEQVLQGAAGNRVDTLVELIDTCHIEAAEQDRRPWCNCCWISARFCAAQATRSTPGTVGVHSSGKPASNNGRKLTRLDVSLEMRLRTPRMGREDNEVTDMTPHGTGPWRLVASRRKSR